MTHSTSSSRSSPTTSSRCSRLVRSSPTTATGTLRTKAFRARCRRRGRRSRACSVRADAERCGVRGALSQISRNAVDAIGGHLNAVETLESRADAILRTVADPVARTYLLLEDCRRIGTLAFAHLARDAFIAMEWLRSLVRVDVLGQ